MISARSKLSGGVMSSHYISYLNTNKLDTNAFHKHTHLIEYSTLDTTLVKTDNIFGFHAFW